MMVCTTPSSSTTVTQPESKTSRPVGVGITMPTR